MRGVPVSRTPYRLADDDRPADSPEQTGCQFAEYRPADSPEQTRCQFAEYRSADSPEQTGCQFAAPQDYVIEYKGPNINVLAIPFTCPQFQSSVDTSTRQR